MAFSQRTKRSRKLLEARPCMEQVDVIRQTNFKLAPSKAAIADNLVFFSVIPSWALRILPSNSKSELYLVANYGCMTRN